MHLNVHKAFVYGESANLIVDQIKSKIAVYKCKNLEEVIYKIFKQIDLKNDKKTILFAPACTSYDHYKNYEVRGNHFTTLIKKFSKRY